MTVAWTLGAKDFLKNVNCFSPNQLVYLQLALENKTTSQTFTKNLNALHSARKKDIKN